ncbi:MAG: SDR family oxidoreductase [Acidimicrobiia bacterium]
MRLAGRSALVTGAGSGIGAATARRFAEEGASVTVADVDGEAAFATVDEIVSGGGAAVACTGDVSVADDAVVMVDAAVEAHGGLHVLVNNAGVERTGSVVAMPEEDWDLVFDVNVKGGFLCSKAAIPAIRESGGGSILFTASVGGLWGCTGQAAYSAAKAAVVNMTQSLALDHSGHGIRVNCVCPGGTRTPMATATIEMLGPEVVEMFEEKIKAIVPFEGRLAEPREIADAFVYLASDEASFITGHALVVDGGQHAGMYIPEIQEP